MTPLVQGRVDLRPRIRSWVGEYRARGINELKSKPNMARHQIEIRSFGGLGEVLSFCRTLEMFVLCSLFFVLEFVFVLDIIEFFTLGTDVGDSLLDIFRFLWIHRRVWVVDVTIPIL
ncbi:hypothetical protein FRX31_025730 [Thalictrum thalictroides]|uniref:Uncharacterized protein n=1 Tax=Thalictrum thalictroides TaxID=46969 RepID=A0A7J6VID3_THATH|nr:hypothetical protein FRX31_025730 [Thalictrum thalictroides]